MVTFSAIYSIKRPFICNTMSYVTSYFSKRLKYRLTYVHRNWLKVLKSNSAKVNVIQYDITVHVIRDCDISAKRWWYKHKCASHWYWLLLHQIFYEWFTDLPIISNMIKHKWFISIRILTNMYSACIFRWKTRKVKKDIWESFYIGWSTLTKE